MTAAVEKWDNSHMSTKGKEIRIRNLLPLWKKRIAIAAKESDLSESTFCLYAALERCDKLDAAKKGSK